MSGPGTGSQAGFAQGAATAVRPHQVPALVVASRRAQEHVAYGTDLARRSAFFSARSEFTKALEVIAQARDTEENSLARRRALEAGLKALQEADDFAPLVKHGDARPNLAPVIAAHRTTILKNADRTTLTAEFALQEYYRFATEQVAWAVAGDPAAAQALFGLGRVELVSAERGGTKKTLSDPKATALYRAALLVDPRNYQVANELAVLLARYGQWNDAKVLLHRSLAVRPHAETWHNLSVVCQNLGEREAAEQAHAQSQMLTANAGKDAASEAAATSPGASIQWVEPAAFAAAGPGPEFASPGLASPQSTGVPPKPAPSETANPAGKPPQKEGPLGQIFPWMKPKS